MTSPCAIGTSLLAVALWLLNLTALRVCGTEAPRPRIYLDRIEPHWHADNDRFWYRRDLPGDRREFILVHAVEGTRQPAFDHSRVATALAAATSREIDAQRLPVEAISFAEDSASVTLIGPGQSWRCDLDTYALTPLDAGTAAGTPQPQPPPDRSEPSRRTRRRDREAPEVRSPDGRWEAVVRGHNLHLKDLKAGSEEPLTHDANPDSTYARSAGRARSVEMNYDASDPDPPAPEVYWSPDSRRLVAMRNRPGTDRTVYMVASSPADQVQPRLESYPYLKPGDEIPVRKPRLFDVEERRELPLSDALFRQPWSVSHLRWSSNSTHFTFLYNERGHQVLRVVAVDAWTGETRSTIEERSTTFICYSQKFFYEPLDRSREILWMSERSGWNHLYLYDADTGAVKNPVTTGEWVVRQVERVDPERRQIWFQAGGVIPGQDPYYVHSCRVNFDGTGFVVLTEGDGQHSVRFSPDRRFLIDTWSRVNRPPVTELRRASDGSLVCLLEEADASEVFAGGWTAPEPFVAKGRDDRTDIHGVLHWPRDFDPARRYPVIEHIYAGPHSAFVPKAFQASYRWQSLLDRGFVVVQIDGMGTAHRSKAFHDVCWKNLGDAGFPDRILWLKAAAARHPQLDLSRVGIYGGSAGGQNALRALLAHGDFYKAAAADCGCHDNRMDKIWWNEQWMGWPVGPHYAEQSNVTQAHRLQGKLLLTVGELDRNVDPASTYQVVDALIKADKDFDLIVFPGQGHGAGGSPYGIRRRDDFFVRHLSTPEPDAVPVSRTSAESLKSDPRDPRRP